jgi:nitrite reductase/ring-hydroxylating ferredoxin subunit
MEESQMQFAAKVSEIPQWGKKTVEVNGMQLLLINIKGEIFACENECPHQGSPLTGGIVKDGPILSCPRHGYRFNLKSGACSDYPEYTLKIYPVKIEGDDVMVDL